MVVQLGSIEDFCSELRDRSDAVRERIVRCATVRAPEQKERVSFAVGISATTVLNTEDGPCLIEYSGLCGRDTPAKGDEGSQEAARMDRLLRETCDDLALRVRPGKNELV